jgi:ribonuclease D
MKMRFFWIPVRHSTSAEEELNAFLAQHRVIEVERYFSPSDSGWTVCVEMAEGDAKQSKPAPAPRNQTDYREVLDPETFKIFAALRTWRKVEAERHGVPLYAVASNGHLATISNKRPNSLAELEKTTGFGAGRVKKYGDGLLKCLERAVAESDPEDTGKKEEA